MLACWYFQFLFPFQYSCGCEPPYPIMCETMWVCYLSCHGVSYALHVFYIMTLSFIVLHNVLAHIHIFLMWSILILCIISWDHMRFLCNDYFSSYASLISLHLTIYIGGDLIVCVLHSKANISICIHLGGAFYVNSCSWHFILSILLPCSNHIVINSPKRGDWKCIYS